MKDEKEKKLNIGILFSGGDCQTINTFIGTILKNKAEYNVFFIMNGYEELFKNLIYRIDDDYLIQNKNLNEKHSCTKNEYLDNKNTIDHMMLNNNTLKKKDTKNKPDKKSEADKNEKNLLNAKCDSLQQIKMKNLK